MSKELEAFYDLLSPIGMTKQGIEKYCLIEKALKALEIIKKKRVDIDLFLRVAKFNNVELYNFEISNGIRNLTQEEFDLLKEVFDE